MPDRRGFEANITRIKLCGVQGCCPSVEIHRGSDKIVITDDDGGKVTLTKEQSREMLAKDNIEQIAEKVNREITKWSREHKRLIVVIDGYAGSGKTSIANRIAELNSDCLVVHLDDFIKHWKTRKQMMDTAQDRSRVFEYKWYRYDALERLVRAFQNGRRKHICLKLYDFDKNEFTAPRAFDLSKNILIIEGIFLLHPRHKRNTLWGKRVFLNVDLERAEERRISREKRRWGEAYLPEDHPDSYMRDFRNAYTRYLNRYKPEQNADLVIDVDAIEKRRGET